jgi:hypothetical protein
MDEVENCLQCGGGGDAVADFTPYGSGPGLASELGIAIYTVSGEGSSSAILDFYVSCVSNARSCSSFSGCGGWLGDLACAVLGDIAAGPFDDIEILVGEALQCTLTSGVCSPQNFAGVAPLCPSSCGKWVTRSGKVLGLADEGATARKGWGLWSDYDKVIVDGREYAQIGERLYTRHAIDNTLPKGLGGRSVSPANVEATIATGTISSEVRDGALRTTHTSGDVQVVTEQGGRIVVTVLYQH